MTTDRQELAVQVAEVIWRWRQLTDHKPFENGCTVWEKTEDADACYEMNIENEVFSWAGFGRTLEIIPRRIINGKVWAKIDKIYGEFITGQIPKEELWERTHKAALEALKEKK